MDLSQVPPLDSEPPINQQHIPVSKEQDIVKSSKQMELLQCLSMSRGPGVRIIDASDGFTDSVLYPSGNFLLQWRPNSKMQSVKLEHKSAITAVAYNRESGLAASADADQRVSLWELSSFEVLLTINVHGVICDLDFSHDGRLLGAISTDLNNSKQRILIWDLLSDQDSMPAVSAELPAGEFHECLRFSGMFNNRLISNGSRSVYFWTFDNLDEGCSLKCIIPNTDSIKKDTRFTVSTFMPCKRGKQWLDFEYGVGGLDAVTGTNNGNLILWKLDKDRSKSTEQSDDYFAEKTLNSTPHKISLLTTKGMFLLVGSKGGALNFLDSELKLSAWMDGFGEGYIRSISFSNFKGGLSITDSDFIVESDGEIYRSSSCQKEDKKPLWKPHWLQNVQSLALHPRQARIAGIEGPNHLLIFNIDTLEVIRRKQMHSNKTLSCISYFRDGKQICIGFASGEVSILDEGDLSITAELRNCKCRIHRVTVNGSGCCLAAVNEKEELLLYVLVESEQGTARWEYRGKQSSEADVCSIRSFDFYDTPNGQSRLFALMKTGALVEIDITNSTLATGLVIHKLLPKPREGLCFCLAPPLRYFDKSNSDIDVVIAEVNGKLQVDNLHMRSHVYAHLPLVRDTPLIQFGFFQRQNADSRPLMWYATAAGQVGITPWPLSTNPTNCQMHITLDGVIKSVQICHDAERILIHTSTTISIWKIHEILSQTEAFNPEDCFDKEVLFSISECFDFFHRMNCEIESKDESQKVITIEQMELVMCRLGFYPTVDEVQDMISEFQIQSYRELDEEWSGDITQNQFLSLFARYHRLENIDEITKSFIQLMDGYEEISKEDFLWKLDSTLLPIHKEVQKSLENVFGQEQKLEGTEIRPFSDYINLENFLNWLQIDP